MAAGNWQLAAPHFTGGRYSRFKNSRLAKQRMTAGSWQLAAAAFHRGEVFKIQEFKISEEPNGCLWPDAKSQRPVLISVF